MQRRTEQSDFAIIFMYKGLLKSSYTASIKSKPLWVHQRDFEWFFKIMLLGYITRSAITSFVVTHVT